MMDDGHSVPAELDIELETVAALPYPKAECSNRVFRGVPRGSPVSQNKHRPVTPFINAGMTALPMFHKVLKGERGAGEILPETLDAPASEGIPGDSPPWFPLWSWICYFIRGANKERTGDSPGKEERR
jgi:hypothetical protein